MTTHVTNRLRTITAQGGDDDDPIVDFISALILSGRYVPTEHGIPEGAIIRFKHVHAFCTEHQAVTGTAPTPEHIARRFPDFPLTTDMPIEWASHQMHNHHLENGLSRLVRTASQHLVDSDPRSAWQTLSEGVRSYQPKNVQAIDVFDADLITQVDSEACPVAGRTLSETTGGARPGELWFIGARPGRGKSIELLRHARTAMEAGWNVVLFSMEMTAKEVSDRFSAMLWGYEAFDAMEPEARVASAAQWAEGKGTLGIFDPSVMRCDTLAVASAAQPHTLMLIDHIGLMRSANGSRSIEDHRIAAAISNELKEIAGEVGIPVIAASQLNRRSEERKTAPSLIDLAQTDSSGQDGDMVYTITAAPGSRVQQMTLIKNRRGPAWVRWYQDFRPAIPSFEEISKGRASDLLEKESLTDNAI